MQADFSRRTFDSLKHFSAVLAQQGRVQLDADANEQAAILLYQLRTTVADLLGQSAAPAEAPGFRIDPRPDHAKITDLGISAGRLYVDGLLVENDRPTSYWTQPEGYLDQDADDPLPETGPFVVYLRVWERLVTALQDPAIREIALGDPGPDTAARAKVAWQVAWCAGQSGEDFADFLRSLNPEPGLLAAQAKHPGDTDACHLPPEARFRGQENQLYRVEVHTGGRAWTDSLPVKGFSQTLHGATFKWSRENASVVFPVVSVSGATVTLGTLGRDSKLDLDVGDWVELLDDASATRVADDVPAGNRPESAPPLRKVVAIDPADRLVTLDDDLGEHCGPGSDPDLHPFLRRWDHLAPADSEDGAVPLVENTWIDLEDGVQVRFEAPPRTSADVAAGQGGTYRRGDYWQIPARTVTGDVEWPRGDDGPRPVPPHGVEYHYAVLGVLDANGTVTHPPDTFEPLFRQGSNPAAPEPPAEKPKPAPEIDAPPVAHPTDSVVFAAEKAAGATAPAEPKAVSPAPTPPTGSAGAGGNGSATAASTATSTHSAGAAEPEPTSSVVRHSAEAAEPDPTSSVVRHSAEAAEPDPTSSVVRHSAEAAEPDPTTSMVPTSSAVPEADDTSTSPTTPNSPEPSTEPEKPAMPQPTTPLGDHLTSWLRTVVPGLWSALVAWLVSLGLPSSVTDAVAGLGNQVIVPLVLAVVYALLRQLEPKMPPWLTRVLLGSNRPPSYAETEADHALG
ncbi:DUF6519 domain-containing protein [Amycolatopsis sp. GA6-003]|uniref:DUF6519 domain-containing protein n=1 Tax=Amycolatopsis sp. GA6-003 TaxID=2652444 RepID=UPI00391714CF